MTLDLTAPRASLLAALTRANDVTDRKSPAAHYGYALLSADTWGLRVDAASASLGWSGQVDAEIRSEGAIAAPAYDLLAKVTALPDGQIRVQDTGAQIKLSSVAGKRSFVLAGVPASDVPKPPEPDTGTERAQLNTTLLGNVLGSVLHAVSEDGTRANLHAVHLVSRGGVLEAAATDGHRCARTRVAVEGLREFQALITPRAAEALRGVSAETAELTVTDSRLFCAAGRTTLSAALVVGVFPTLDKVIPRGGRPVRLKRAALVASLRSIVDGACGKEGPALLDLRDGTLTIDAGAGRDELSYEAIEPVTIATNCRAVYLLEAAKSLECAELELVFGDGPLDVIVMRPVEGTFPDSVRVVMPVRT